MSQAPDPRTELIAGLRELAAFIEAHPEMPIPDYPKFDHCIGPCPDADGLAVAQTLAEVLDVEPTVSGGHTDVNRRFRGLEYRAFYIARDRMAAHAAEQSYTRNVQVDTAKPSADPSPPRIDTEGATRNAFRHGFLESEPGDDWDGAR